jgi:uracil-DNA glycosylase family 4
MTDAKTLKHVYDAVKKKFKDKKLVFGRGVSDAEILVISDTPAPDSHETGNLFDIKHERLLNQLLKGAGINKKKIYLTNAIKYYPSQQIAPTPKEIKSHSSFLKDEIKTINPKFVVTLGNVALNGVGMRQPLDNVHGRTFNLGSYTLLPTFHPEHALKDPKVKTLLELDFQKLKTLLTESKNTKIA